MPVKARYPYYPLSYRTLSHGRFSVSMQLHSLLSFSIAFKSKDPHNVKGGVALAVAAVIDDG